MEPMKATSVNSRAEELFVQLFCEAFGPEKTENLQVQYPCVDIYGATAEPITPATLGPIACISRKLEGFSL